MSKREKRKYTEEELRKKMYYYGTSSSHEFVRRKSDSGELIDGECERVESDQPRIGPIERIDFQDDWKGVRGPVGERGLDGVRGPKIDPEFLADIMAQVEAARPDQRSLKQKHPKLWYIPEAMFVISVVLFAIVWVVDLLEL